MKVKIKEVEQKEGVFFPRLMINKVKQIVLFTSPSEGTLVCDKDVMSNSNFGYHSKSWIGVSDFRPFIGSVTLSND